MGTLNKFEVVIEPEKLAEEERQRLCKAEAKAFKAQ
jgi:hypothetical protein